MTRIVGISDVSVGYGSPQVTAFMTSLQQVYQTQQVLLIEPDHPERIPRHELFPNLCISRVYSQIHPYTTAGRIQYMVEAARLVNDEQPDVLVVFCSYSLPALFKLRRRPRMVIYYAIEQPSAYGPLDVEMNRQLSGLVDLIIYPEENRAARDIETCGYRGIPTAVLYNCANPPDVTSVLPTAERNGRVLYQGTIEEGRTFAEYYYDPRLTDISIDLFGNIGGSDRAGVQRRLAQASGDIRYLGYVDARFLEGQRRHYSYSITSWNPNTENQLYACPNKFFESIAAGVPPITAPHPQTKMLTEQYQCGIVMTDWSFEAMKQALNHAMRLVGTDAYDRMVENCKRAVSLELNWDVQFSKIKPYLK